MMKKVQTSPYLISDAHYGQPSSYAALVQEGLLTRFEADYAWEAQMCERLKLSDGNRSLVEAILPHQRGMIERIAGRDRVAVIRLLNGETITLNKMYSCTSVVEAAGDRNWAACLADRYTILSASR